MKDKAPLDLARGVARSTSWILTWAVSGSTWILVDLDMGGVKIHLDLARGVSRSTPMGVSRGVLSTHATHTPHTRHLRPRRHSMRLRHGETSENKSKK